jgi:hypothetical protein
MNRLPSPWLMRGEFVSANANDREAAFLEFKA